MSGVLLCVVVEGIACSNSSLIVSALQELVFVSCKYSDVLTVQSYETMLSKSHPRMTGVDRLSTTTNVGVV